MKKVAISLILIAQSAVARQENLANLSLEQLANVHVVTATKTEVAVSKAPSTTYVFTAEEIARRGYRNLVQLLADIPEIEINARGSVESYNLTTVRGVVGYNRNLLILQDGIQIASITGGRSAYGYNIPLHQAKRVEVVLGPYSALYGSDALLGVVNIVTWDAKDVADGNATLSIGRYTTTDNSIIFGKDFGNKSGVLLDASQYYSAEPDFPNLYPDLYQGYFTYLQSGTLQGVSGPVQYPVYSYSAPTSDWTVGAKVTLPHFEFGYWRSFHSHSSSLGGRPERSLYVSEAKLASTIESYYGRYLYKTSDDVWQLVTQISKGSETVQPDSQYLDAYNNFSNGYKYENDNVVNFNEEVHYRISKKSNLIGGFLYQDFSSLPKTADLPSPYNTKVGTGEQNLNFPGTSIPIPFYALWYQNYSPYAQLEFSLSRKATLILGARYDYYTRFGGSLNPRLSVVFLPVDRLQIKLLYGEAFRAPSPYSEYDLFGAFTTTNGTPTGGRFNVPNPGLQPEKIRSMEADLRYDITSDVVVKGDAFFNHLYDVIESTPLPAGYTFMGVPVTGTTFANRGLLISYGGTVQVEAVTRPGSFYLKPYLAYTFVGGHLDQDVLPNTARNTIKTGIDLNRKGFSLSPRLEYRTRSYVPNTVGVYAPTYYVVNLGARYENVFHAKKYKTAVFLNISNLLDRRYANSNLLNYAQFGATPQDPFRFQIGVTLNF